MITVEIDGYYCKTCQQWHSLLSRHEKFDSYLLNRKEKFEEAKKKRPMLFGDAEFVDTLPARKLEENNAQEPCAVCGDLTFFRNAITKHFVCSEKCRYADNGEEE